MLAGVSSCFRGEGASTGEEDGKGAFSIALGGKKGRLLSREGSFLGGAKTGKGDELPLGKKLSSFSYRGKGPPFLA